MTKNQEDFMTGLIFLIMLIGAFLIGFALGFFGKSIIG